jgi:GH3 auxin-responsive promoter
MQFTATVANSLWSASNLPAYWQFRRALRDPQAAQNRKLRAYLQRNARTAFGKEHQFDTIRSYREFTRRVPVADYDAFQPWIDRIRAGESNVLTHQPVTHLVPTSGSTGARKLIPFTAGSQREFQAAIGPWLIDLQQDSPGLLAGPAYWSITPVLGDRPSEDSVLPIGFDTDTAYLGGVRRRLVEAVMAVPTRVQQAESLETFRRQTLLHLLSCSQLRLISVWHPSFLALLLDALPVWWDELIRSIEHGAQHLPSARRRAQQLRAADPRQPESLWPALRLISCWGDGAAEPAAADLQRRFPDLRLQPKGLIATEAFVTLPFRGQYPLAVNSHMFEFIDDHGRVLPVESLREGAEYETVVTTAGGLWRYRLGDRVRVSGWVHQTPSLKFLARAGALSDWCGEKLSEPFVASALRRVFGRETPRFALLAPNPDDGGLGYTLYVEGLAQSDWAETLDHELRANPHYAYCRDLGQLRSINLFIIAERGFEAFASRQAAHGARLGDVKPLALSSTTGWSNTFSVQPLPSVAEDRVSPSLGEQVNTASFG